MERIGFLGFALAYLIKYYRELGKPLTTVCPADSNVAAKIARALQATGYIVTAIDSLDGGTGIAVPLGPIPDDQITSGSIGRRVVDTYRRMGLCAVLAKALREIGGRPLAKLQYFFDGKFDRRYGTSTRGVVKLWDLPFHSPNKSDAIGYQPTAERTFRKMMSHLPKSLTGFDFVDVGCGKGRVLLYATAWDFNGIIGIDFSPELSDIARRNVAAFARVTGENRIEARWQDAVDMVPPERPCVFFFAAPFVEPLLSKVVARIEASYRSNPRKIYVVYYATRSVADIVSTWSFLKPVAQGSVCLDFIAQGIYAYAVFESIP